MITTLGDRMKKYEDSYDYKIIHRLPLIFRLDGCRFSKFTKRAGFKKPFDVGLSEIMSTTTKYLASKIQGCVLGYTQSDEINLIVKTDQSENSIPWYDNRIVKMSSVASSFATGIFNKQITSDHLASFDCRVFAVPDMTEAINNLIFRQNDAIRNSILNASIFGVGEIIGRGTARKLIHGLKCNDLKEFMSNHGINWDEYPEEYKYGVLVFRQEMYVETKHGGAMRKSWVCRPAPVFTSEVGRKDLGDVLDVKF